MESNVDATVVGHSLRERVPGESVITELLRAQQEAPPRGVLGRLFGASPLAAEALPWFAGALGEIEVARILAGLGRDYTVLHAVPVGAGDSDIDHVVLGPAGVFTLNTKRHHGKKVWVSGGTLMVNGTKQPYLRNSVHEAKRATKLLSQAVGRPVDVAAMIVVVGAARLDVKKKHETVAVLDSRELQRWFRRRPANLSPGEVEQIVTTASQPGVWHQGPPADPSDPEKLQASFESLRRSVRAADYRRLLWIMALAGVPLVTGIVMAYSKFTTLTGG